jgi:hypothetical protein
MRTHFRWIFALLCAGSSALAQTKVNLGSQTTNVDFSSFTSTRPFQVSTSFPSNCQTGALLFRSDFTSGSNLYGCINGTWSLQGRTSISNINSTGQSVGSSPAVDGTIQLRRLNTNNNRLSITLDTVNDKIDLDVLESALNLANMSGTLSATKIADRQGNGTSVLMFGTGTPANGDCAQFDSSGNIVSTGAPCAQSTLTAGPGLSLSAGQMRVSAAEVPSFLQINQAVTWTTEIVAGTCGEQSFTFTGAAVGDAVSLGVPEDLPVSVMVMGLVKTPNEFTIRVCNFTTAPLTPSGTYQAWLHKRFQ